MCINYIDIIPVKSKFDWEKYSEIIQELQKICKDKQIIFVTSQDKRTSMSNRR